MIAETRLFEAQRTNGSPDGICQYFHFKKADFQTFLREYIDTHQRFIKECVSMSLVGDEGYFLFTMNIFLYILFSRSIAGNMIVPTEVFSNLYYYSSYITSIL